MMITSNTARVSARMPAVAVVAMASLVFAGPDPADAGADVQGLSSVALAKRSVLCDRTRRGVVTRQHFAPTFPSRLCSGNRSAAEPETRALMKLFTEIQPQLVVIYHSEGDVLELPSNGVATPRAVRAYGRASQVHRKCVKPADVQRHVQALWAVEEVA